MVWIFPTELRRLHRTSICVMRFFQLAHSVKKSIPPFSLNYITAQK
jgi:hypothetical protein